MKKMFLVIATLFVTIIGYAQSSLRYCDLAVYQPLFKNYVAELHIDSNTKGRKFLLRDAQGEKIKFASATDALNYVVSLQGWKLVTSFAERGGITHFILEK